MKNVFGWSLPPGTGKLPDEENEREIGAPISPECPGCHSYRVEQIGQDDEDGIAPYQCFDCGKQFVA